MSGARVCNNPTAIAIQAARWALPATQLERRDAVMNFWFTKDAWRPETPADQAPKPNFDLWFGGTPEIDAEITGKFKADAEAAIKGDYKNWAHHSPESLLALIILLDQFPMNIYRDQATGYDVSELAIPLAYTAIGRGWIERVHPSMRVFFTLPLMHSEKVDDQFALVDRNPSDEFALIHANAVKEHGRFPGRNKAHGRVSTDAEKEYFAKGGEF